MMRKLQIFIPILVLLFVGCNDGPAGPRGAQGPPGEDGVNILGQAFEEEISFNEPNYSRIVEFPSDIEVFESDIVVVHWRFEENQETGYDVWQQLPATNYFEDGQFQYSFDHTLADVQIFLQGNIDFGTLGDGYTQDQHFRIVVLPVEEVERNNIDLSNMDQVMGMVKNSHNIERIKK